MILAIDPGLRGCGVAAFGSELVFCAYPRNPEARARGPGAWWSMAQAVYQAVVDANVPLPRTLVVEVPQVYAGSKQKGDPNDLIQLAGVLGALTGLFRCATVGYAPREWKGQVPKDVHNRRILGKLSASERTILESCGVSQSLQHNVIDAVGLGKFHLSRS